MLRDIPFTCDIIVTSPFDEVLVAGEMFEGIPNVNKYVPIKCENRGRNFGPLLVTAGKILLNYDIVCHAHSKKSLYTGKEQSEWADYLFYSLFSDAEILDSHLKLFSSHPNVGMIAPVPFYRVPFWGNHWLKNEHIARILFERFKIPFHPGFITYPVGGMFWFRPQALLPLLNEKWTYDDFPSELGQTDGTIHHAIERSLPFFVKRSGSTVAYYEPWTNKYADDSYDELALYKRETKSDLAAICRSQSVVSFDIFDTVFQRRSLDKEIGKKAVASYLSANGHDIGEADFVNLRNKCELEIRQSMNFEGDVLIYDIYNKLCKTLNIQQTSAIALANKEFYGDLNDQIPRSIIVGIINDLWHSLRKRIIFVSDTYYSAPQVHHMLRAAGVTAEYKLFLSSEIKDRKDTGRIWKSVLADINARHSEIVHIGDNVVSDVQIPAELGIDAYLVISNIDKAAHIFRDVADVEDVAHSRHDWRATLLAFGSNPFFYS